jgi:hypothetical protein
MQSKVKIKQKCTLQMGEWTGSRQITALGGSKTSSFYGVHGPGSGQSWKTGVCVINIQRLVMYHHLLPYVGWESTCPWIVSPGLSLSMAVMALSQQDPAVCH